jgi:hypothetical protein
MARFQPFNAAAAIQAGQGIARNNMALQAAQGEMQKQSDVRAAGGDQKLILDALMRHGDIEGAQRAAQFYDYVSGRDRNNVAAEQQATATALGLVAQLAPLAAKDPVLYPALVREMERGKLIRPGEMPSEYDPAQAPALLQQVEQSVNQILSGGAANKQFGTKFPEDAAFKVESQGGKLQNITTLYGGTKPSTASDPETWQELSAEESKAYGPGRFQRSTRGQIRQIKGTEGAGGGGSVDATTALKKQKELEAQGRHPTLARAIAFGTIRDASSPMGMSRVSYDEASGTVFSTIDEDGKVTFNPDIYPEGRRNGAPMSGRIRRYVPGKGLVEVE